MGRGRRKANHGGNTHPRRFARPAKPNGRDGARDCRPPAMAAASRLRYIAVADLSEQGRDFLRSEAHTSELQSLMRTSYSVFCLTKKNNTTRVQTQNQDN